ncbi:MAG: DUF1963 domain-containing protein [Acutalibacteraceae bacterium]
MDGIKLKISKPKEKLPAGASKLLGNPDVWDGFAWPYIEENGEKYDLAFMCQINCTDTAVFDKNEWLPKAGILYFFYDLDTMPESADEKSARVLWYNGDMSVLHEIMLTDEDGNSLAFSEQKIDFEVADADEKSAHLLLGDMTQGCDFINGCLPLLRIGSLETEDAEICFKGNGTLCFFFEEEKLKAHDFSEVKAAQI